MFNTTCRNNQKVVINLRPVGPNGEPEPLDGPPTVQMTQGAGNAVATVLDPNTIEIVPNDGFEGPIEVEIDADAAAGPETQILTETVHVDVFHPNAVSLGLTTSVVPKSPA